jgi:hypothetical protein
MLGERPQIVTSNNADDRLHFYTLEYTPEQRRRLLEADDISDVEPIPGFRYDTHNDGLRRLIREILEAASGETPASGVVEHIERALLMSDGPFDTAHLFRGIPGRQPAVETRKRVSADLLRHGVRARNPNGRGFVVADLDPGRG